MRADESCFSNGYLDTPVDWIAGMLPSARLRDLPTFIRTTDPDDTMLTINIKQCELDSPAADGILLNTFDDLERQALDSIPHVPPQHLHHWPGGGTAIVSALPHVAWCAGASRDGWVLEPLR